MGDLIQLAIFVASVGCGYFFGSMIEKKHYQSIAAREEIFLHMPVVTSKNLLDQQRVISEAQFVYGNVAISADYFKIIFAGLRNFLGGRVTAYESLLDRARREAILRLKASAPGADIILNLRIQTTDVNPTSVEVFACGTAVYYKK